MALTGGLRETDSRAAAAPVPPHRAPNGVPGDMIGDNLRSAAPGTQQAYGSEAGRPQQGGRQSERSDSFGQPSGLALTLFE